MGTREIGIEVYDRWAAMWNGDLSLADKIMAPGFRLRYAQPGADVFDDITRPAELAALIAEFRAARNELRYAPEGEAVVDLELIDGEATGMVARPYGSTQLDENGREVTISGTDVLRLENGLITEVWSVSGGRAGRPFYNDSK